MRTYRFLNYNFILKLQLEIIYFFRTVHLLSRLFFLKRFGGVMRNLCVSVPWRTDINIDGPQTTAVFVRICIWPWHGVVTSFWVVSLLFWCLYYFFHYYLSFIRLLKRLDTFWLRILAHKPSPTPCASRCIYSSHMAVWPGGWVWVQSPVSTC